MNFFEKDWKEDIKDIKARLVILEEINKNLVVITGEIKTMLFFMESQANAQKNMQEEELNG